MLETATACEGLSASCVARKKKLGLAPTCGRACRRSSWLELHSLHPVMVLRCAGAVFATAFALLSQECMCS